MKKIYSLLVAILFIGCAAPQKPMSVLQFPKSDVEPIEMTFNQSIENVWNTLITEYFLYIQYSKFDLDNHMIEYNIPINHYNYFDCGQYVIYNDKIKYEILPLASEYEYTKSRGDYTDTYTVKNDMKIHVRVKLTPTGSAYFRSTNLKAVVFYTIKQTIELKSSQTGDVVIGNVTKKYKTNNYRSLDIRFNDSDIACTTNGNVETVIRNGMRTFL
jgi:hypothetical protein